MYILRPSIAALDNDEIQREQYRYNEAGQITAQDCRTFCLLCYLQAFVSNTCFLQISRENISNSGTLSIDKRRISSFIIKRDTFYREFKIDLDVLSILIGDERGGNNSGKILPCVLKLTSKFSEFSQGKKGGKNSNFRDYPPDCGENSKGGED